MISNPKLDAHAGHGQYKTGEAEAARFGSVMVSEIGPGVVNVGAGMLVVGTLLVIGGHGGQTVEDMKGIPKVVPDNAHRQPRRAI